MRGRAREAAAGVVAWVALACGASSCATTRPCAFVLDGACVSPREVDAYCGARSVGASCAVAACPAGDAVDLREASCVPQRTVREIVARDRPSPVPDGTTIACHDDHVLVAHGDHAVCLARADACPRTTHAAARGCVPDRACPAGQVRAGDACVRVVTRGVLDVGAWSRAVLGPDGGAGGDRLCRVLTQAPWDFGVGPGGSRAVALTIDLSFPDNDVTQATATATAPADLPPAALLAAQAALDPLVLPLRALGGTADAASATVRVSCAIHGTASPLLLPP